MSLVTDVAQALREHGLTAAISALTAGLLALAASVTRRAFTNEAMLKCLEHELTEERDRVDKQRAEDRKVDADRLASIETDIREIRDMLFQAFQRGKGE